MPDGNSYSPYTIIGKLTQDFILSPEGKAINNIPGGSLLYTAIGMSPWEKNPGLVARVGKNFPEEFIQKLRKYHYSINGIKRIALDIEHRNFISYFDYRSSSEYDSRKKPSVLSQYYYAGQPFPKELLGFQTKQNNTDSLDSRTPETVLARDIPAEYLEARCVHLCAMDYISHNLLPQAFSGNVKRTITLQAGSGYMLPVFFDAIKTLINGLTAFIAREYDIRNLFSEKFRISDIREMMLTLMDYGAENIIVRMEDSSYLFINQTDRICCRLKPIDTGDNEKIGELSCFCGAHLIGLNETYDYRKAAAYGAARASLLKNEINPYNNADVLDILLNEKIRIMENLIEG